MFKVDTNSLFVIINSLKSFLFQILGSLFAILITIYVSRNLGASGMGVLAIINQITNIAVIIGLFGFDNVLVKEISIARNNKDFKRIVDVNSTALKFTLKISICIVIFLLISAPFLDKYIYPNKYIFLPLIIISLSTVPQVISRIYSSSLIGFNKIWQASLFDKFLTPAFVLMLLIILRICKVRVTLSLIAILYLTIRIGVGLIIRYFWICQININILGEKIKNQLLPMAKPLLVVSVSSILFGSIDILTLSYFSDSVDVGVFNICYKIGTLNIFLLMAIDYSIRPKLAVLFKNNKIDEMNKMLRIFTLILFVVGVFFLLVFIFFGKPLLTIWGNEFIIGYKPLIIIGIGQFINCATSVCGPVMVMCGLERLHKNLDLFFVIFHLFVSILMCSKYGIIGSAFSFMLIIILSNLLKLYYCRKKLGLFKFV